MTSRFLFVAVRYPQRSGETTQNLVASIIGGGTAVHVEVLTVVPCLRDTLRQACPHCRLKAEARSHTPKRLSNHHIRRYVVREGDGVFMTLDDFPYDAENWAMFSVSMTPASSRRTSLFLEQQLGKQFNTSAYRWNFVPFPASIVTWALGMRYGLKDKPEEPGDASDQETWFCGEYVCAALSLADPALRGVLPEPRYATPSLVHTLLHGIAKSGSGGVGVLPRGATLDEVGKMVGARVLSAPKVTVRIQE